MDKILRRNIKKLYKVYIISYNAIKLPFFVTNKYQIFQHHSSACSIEQL